MTADLIDGAAPRATPLYRNASLIALLPVNLSTPGPRMHVDPKAALDVELTRAAGAAA